MKKKLGEILVTTGAVSGADVEAALRDQSAGEPSRLGDLLVANGKLSSAQLARALAEQYQLPFVDLPPLPQAVLDLVPLDLQRQFRFVPLKSDGTEIFIAMADLANIEVLAVLEQQWTKVHVHVAGGDEIDALHATLSGIFGVQPDEQLPSVAPSISPFSPSADDLFGSLDVDPVPELAPTALNSMPSPVPVIAPVQTLHSSTAPLAEDLFGDLNLESARTGIAARPPEDIPDPVEPGEPLKNVTRPLGAVVTFEMAAVPEPEESLAPPVEDPAPEIAPSEPFQEGSGPVLMGEREGTGPLLDMLLVEGTGPVVDTPFFRDAAGEVVPTLSDAPFLSSRSSLSALAIPPPQPTAPAAELASAPAPAPLEPPPGEALPDWLRTEPSMPRVELPTGATSSNWTGALDHLMPSKLVVGLTKVLLARGLVTEEEILAALGQKK